MQFYDETDYILFYFNMSNIKPVTLINSASEIFSSEDESNSSYDASDVFQPTHCPIIQFEGNPLFPEASKYYTQSNIVSGVFKALYAWYDTV